MEEFIFKRIDIQLEFNNGINKILKIGFLIIYIYELIKQYNVYLKNIKGLKKE